MSTVKGILFIALFIAAITACAGQGDSRLDAPTPSRLTESGTASPDQPSTLSPASAEMGDVIIRYKEGEFVPKRVDIELGQIVAFVNDSEKRIWPASNIHPTHEIYPAFDPETPIDPGGVWLFTFDQAGFWRYHNHVSPSDSALVVVRGGTATPAKARQTVDPQELRFKKLGAVSVQDAIDLFRDDVVLARYVKEYGPAATVAMLGEYETRVGGDCHQRAHIMGRIAYEYFGAFAFSLSGHECHSGGYHGATEAFFRDRGTATLKTDISIVCGGSLNDFFRHQCIHGIGHGLMAWTSYELIDALDLCDLLDTTQDRESCYSGTFMENVVGGLSGSMGHFTDFLSDDPHFPCNVLGEKYVAPCYFYQTSRMIQLFGGDFEKVAEACAEAPQASHTLCFQSMGRDVGGATRGNPEEAIQSCSYVQDPQNRLDCLAGAVQDSLWDAGGADDALALCGLLSDSEEKARCYWTIIWRAKDIYDSAADLQAFCARVEEGYRQGCP